MAFFGLAQTRHIVFLTPQPRVADHTLEVSVPLLPYAFR